MSDDFKDTTKSGRKDKQTSGDVERARALAGMQRMDGYVQAALSGMLANPAWNSESAQRYLTAKKLNLEQLAVASAMEVIIQVDKFFKGEVGGEVPDFEQPEKPRLVTP